MKAKLAVAIVLSLFLTTANSTHACDPHTPPIANASANPTLVCVNEPVSFSSEGSYAPCGGSIIEYWWFFDDGDESNSPNPSHSYSEPGDYHPSLKVMCNHYYWSQLDYTDTVTVTANVHNLTQNKWYGKIQSAINEANDSDTIEVGIGTYKENVDFLGKEIILRSTEPNDWSVVGTTIIDANNANLATVTFDDSENSDTVLAGFTISGGLHGIECDGDDTAPVIRNCIITDNGQAGNSGGGIYSCNETRPLITNCFIVDNVADYGAGVYNDRAGMWDGDKAFPATIRNCVISKNTAFYDGGGLYNTRSTLGCYLRIWNCTIINNTASRGGGMYSQGAVNLHVKNCIFWYNSASDQGDEICNSGASPSFEYCDISGSGGSLNWNAEMGSGGSGNIDSPPFFKPFQCNGEGLVAYWKFDENGGTTAYDSAGDNDGNLVNGPAWTTGKIDGALNFDGDDDYVDVPDTASLDPTSFTIATWVYADGSPDDWDTIIDKADDNTFGYQIRINAVGKLTARVRESDTSQHDVTDTDTFPIDQWVFVAWTYDSNNSMLYKDGLVVDSQSGGGQDSSSGKDFIIGSRGTDRYFHGMIDEVRIYDKVLSAAEVTDLYEHGLMGRYRLSYTSPCRNAGGDYSGFHNIGEIDIDNEIRVREGYIDIGADEYVTTEFPYICSFEDYQGFEGVGNWPDGAPAPGDWVKSGYLAKIYNPSFWPKEGPKQSYQCVAIYKNTIFSREFVSEETDNSYIRVNCIPSPSSYINIRQDDVNIASVLFGANDTIYVLDNEEYENCDANYLSIAAKCREFLKATSEPNDSNYSYENTWIELKFIFDWESGSYDVHWRHMNEPNGSVLITEALFDDQYSTFSEVSFETDYYESTPFELNRISISDEAEPGGNFGSNKDIWVTSPEGDWKEPLEGSYDVTGSLWYDKLGRYEIKICPTSEDPCEIIEASGDGVEAQIDNWLFVHEGHNVVGDDDILGYLSTAKFFNGDYYMRIFLYDDLNQLMNPIVVDGNSNAWKTGCITKTVHYNGQYHDDIIAEYPIIGRLKGGQSYHYEAKPDVTINWPGSFPFEFRRIYDSSLRKQLFPLFFGWTHNHNIRVMESTKTDWEISDQNEPEADANGLGIGRLYLLMPLGGRAFEGYVDGDTVIYLPFDNEPDYIERISTITGQEFDVTYTYYGPDGMKYTFEKTDNDLSYQPQDEGAVDWMVYVGIDRQEDRFGNALVYQWDEQDEQELFITEIESEVDGSPTGVKIILDRGSFWEDGPTLYNDISVNDGANPADCYEYSVEFACPEPFGPSGYSGYDFVAIYKATNAESGHQDEEKWYYHKYYEDAGFILDRAPEYIGYAHEPAQHNFRAELRFGDDGLLEEKHIYIDREVTPSGLECGERYFDNYDEQGNLISTTEFYVYPLPYDGQRYKINKTIRSTEGAVLKQEYFVYPVGRGSEWDPQSGMRYYAWPTSSITGGGGVCNVEYVYEDSRFPLKPTTMFEHFDDDGNTVTTYDRHSRTTEIAYDDRGNVAQRKVYADSNNFVLTEYEYHPKYNFPTQQTTWQQYCTESEGEIVLPDDSQKVEQRWIYGDYDGTADANGAYLVRQETLLDSNDWAVTNHTYYSTGQLKTVDSPRTPGIGGYYLCDNKWFVTKIWEGVDVNAGVPSTAPQKRYSYDGLGRVELTGDYLGQVKLYTYDNVGHITSIKTFDDPNAMYCDDGDFVPGSYSDVNFVKLQWFTYYDRYDNCFAERLETGGWLRHEYWHNGKYTMLAHAYTKYGDKHGEPITMEELTQIYPYPCPDAQMLGLWLRGTREFVNRFFYYDSMDRVSRKVDSHRSYWRDDPSTLWKVEGYTYYGNGRIKNKKVCNMAFDGLSSVKDWTLEKDVNYVYDSLDRLIKKVEDPNLDTGLKITTQYGYDAVGNNIYTVDPNESIIFADFDQANRKVCEYYPRPVVYYPGTTDVDVNSSRTDIKKKRETEYFKDNKVKSATFYDRDGETVLAETEFAYDSRGRIADVNQHIQPYGDTAVTAYEYADTGQEFTDPNGDKYHIKITDAEDQVTLIALNIDGKTKRTLYPSGHYENIEDCIRYFWDEDRAYYWRDIYWWDESYGYWQVAVNEIRKTTGRLGGSSHTVVYKRGDFGEITEVNYPGGGHLEFDYNMRPFEDYRKIRKIRDCRTAADKPASPNDILEYEYKHDSRTGGLEEFIVWRNDAKEYVIDYNNVVAWPGRKKGIRVIRPAEPEDEVLYDVSYQYDTVGRLQRVYDPCILDINIASMQYNNNGNRTNLTYYLDGTEGGPNVSTTYLYNSDNSLTAILTTTAGGAIYGLSATGAGEIDGLGRLRNAWEAISYPGQGSRYHTHSYTYDMLSQLTNASITDIGGSTWTAGYDYRDDGNIETKTVNYSDTDYEYDTNSQSGGVFDSDIMTKAGDANLVWDANGRLAETPAISFEYNDDGKLRRAVIGANSIALKYDPQGNRIWKSSTINGDRKYIVDVSGRLPTILCEIDPCDLADPNGSLKKSYIYTPGGQVLAQYDCNGYDEDANSIIVNGKYFYVHDRLGNVRLVVNEDGDVNNTYTYNPFGEEFATECNETVYNPFKFTGQWFDDEIAQYYLRARMYDPVFMRFTARDPVRGKFNDPLTLHKYLYCINDPTNKVDPNGNMFTIIGLVTGVTISDAFRNTEYAYIASSIGVIIPTAIGLVMDYYLFWPYIEKIMDSGNINIWKDYYKKPWERGFNNSSSIDLIYNWFVGDS